MEQYKQSKKNCKEGDEAEFVVKLLQGIGLGGNEVFVLELVVDGNIHS
jgi:hypothetical protein